MKISKVTNKTKKFAYKPSINKPITTTPTVKASKNTTSVKLENLKALFLSKLKKETQNNINIQTINVAEEYFEPKQPVQKSFISLNFLGMENNYPDKIISPIINNGKILNLSSLISNEEVKQNIDFNLSATNLSKTNKALMQEYDVPLDLTKIIPDMFECFSDNLTDKELAIAKKTGAIVNAASKNAQLGISVYDIPEEKANFNKDDKSCISENFSEKDAMESEDDDFDFDRYDLENNFNFSSSKNEIKNLIQRQKNNNSWRNDPNYTPGRSSITNGMYFYENDNLNINGRKAKLKIENDQVFINYPNENINLELTYSDYPYEYGPSPKIIYEKDGKLIEAGYTSFNIDLLDDYYETDLTTGRKIKEATMTQDSIPYLGAGDRGFLFFTTFNNNFLLTSQLNYDDVSKAPEEFILYSKKNHPFFRLELEKNEHDQNSRSLNIFPTPNILQKLVFNNDKGIENHAIFLTEAEDMLSKQSLDLNLDNGIFKHNLFNNSDLIASIDYKKNNDILEPVNINLKNQQINLDKISIDSLFNLLIRKYPNKTLPDLSNILNNQYFNQIAKIKFIEMNNNTIQKTYFNNEDENLNPKDYIIDLNSQGVRIKGTDKNHYNFYDSENNLVYTFQNENGIKTYTKYYPAINIKSNIITVNETDKQNPKYSIDLYDRNGSFAGTQNINLFIKKIFIQTFFNQNTDTQSIGQYHNYLKFQYDNLANNAYQEIDL